MLNDLRCVRCGSHDVRQLDAAIGCGACGQIFPEVLGVPFLGNFERADIPGLIEIAANVANRGQFGLSPQVVADWEEALASYHDARDKQAFRDTHPLGASPHFMNRFGEWLEIHALTQEVNLKGLDVLDVGAGLGWDSQRLSCQGARVTALEFSPLLAEAGRAAFPHIRWLGGLSHVLPFRSASFDAVFFNAALHHMRDVPAAISEALRVLRPGGLLVTTCDSFRPAGSSDELELRVFDAEPAVLSGVNESIPPFDAFTSTLLRHPQQVAVEVWTHTLYDAPRGGTLAELRQWPWPESAKMLAARSGSLAMRIKLLGPWPENAPLQTDVVISARDYADLLDSESVAIARLTSLMPGELIDLPFPGSGNSKFELLNGWRRPVPFEHGRTAYRRARWFMSCPSGARWLFFRVRLLPGCGLSEADLDILVDAEPVVTVTLLPGRWQPVRLPVDCLGPGQRFSVEMRRRDDSTALSAGSFSVCERRFEFAAPVDSVAVPTVHVVIPVFNRRDFTRSCVRGLATQTWPSVRVVVADGGSTDDTVAMLRSEFPQVTVLTTIEELWWGGAVASGIAHVLESCADQDFILLLNDDTIIPDDYIERLVHCSREQRAAVGAVIVDSRDPERVLDAGEYVQWSPYAFPVRSVLGERDRFIDDVHVLPGRGSLVPVHMVRVAGNVDAARFPHYLADYEFFYRLRASGFQLGVCCETRIKAHIEETGIRSSTGVTSFRAVYQEMFARRSMSNVIDHWRFVSLHAPSQVRVRLKARIAARVVLGFLLRTWLRYPVFPLYCLVRLPWRLVEALSGQVRTSRRFAGDLRHKGMAAFCEPERMPGLVRWLLFVAVSPGPIRGEECGDRGLEAKALVACGLLEPLGTEGWYRFRTVPGKDDLPLRNLFEHSWVPWRKVPRAIRYGLAPSEDLRGGP